MPKAAQTIDKASLGAWDDNAVTESYFGEDNWRYVSRGKFRAFKVKGRVLIRKGTGVAVE